MKSSLAGHPLQRLATQTALYGLSSVVGRFLNYLLVPLLTYSFAPVEYGVVAEFYAYMAFLAVLLTCGLETGYFRFCSQAPAVIVYGTALRFLALVNLTFFLIMFMAAPLLATALGYPDHPDYPRWMAAILVLDALGALAFARLRAEQRAARFAAIKLLEIGANVGLNVFFVVLCRQVFLHDPTAPLARLWLPEIGIGYVFLANLLASAFKLLLLTPQLRDGWRAFDGTLLRSLLRYSVPLVLVGMAGIVNETLDRAALKYLLPYDPLTNLAQLGIYSACYKLSILMTLFIQAFRYAAEPFFFAQSRHTDARQLYAAVMTWFVIFAVFIFLLVTLYLDLFQYFVGVDYRAGLTAVPVLLLANLLLGIQINLSLWYKLTDRTLLGAGVAVLGAAVTVVALINLVPTLGAMGAAYAHLVCYGTMVVVSYALGRHYYPVPYELGRVLGYLALGLGLYFAAAHLPSALVGWPGATLLLALFIAVVALGERRRRAATPTKLH